MNFTFLSYKLVPFSQSFHVALSLFELDVFCLALVLQHCIVRDFFVVTGVELTCLIQILYRNTISNIAAYPAAINGHITLILVSRGEGVEIYNGKVVSNTDHMIQLLCFNTLCLYIFCVYRLITLKLFA